MYSRQTLLTVTWFSVGVVVVYSTLITRLLLPECVHTIGSHTHTHIHFSIHLINPFAIWTSTFDSNEWEHKTRRDRYVRADIVVYTPVLIKRWFYGRDRIQMLQHIYAIIQCRWNWFINVHKHMHTIVRPQMTMYTYTMPHWYCHFIDSVFLSFILALGLNHLKW